MIPEKVIVEVYSTTINIDDILTNYAKQVIAQYAVSDEKIEKFIKDVVITNIWKYIPENKISIKFE